MKKLIAKKIKMDQVFQEDGVVWPVTVLRVQGDIKDLTKGDRVKVRGISKGKGFAGVVKRWSFAGGPKTHGQSDRHRAPGSIGGGTDPGRVWKGQKMAGRMGNRQTTVNGLKIVDIESEKGLIWITGAVPGRYNSRIVILSE